MMRKKKTNGKNCLQILEAYDSITSVELAGQEVKQVAKHPFFGKARSGQQKKEPAQPHGEIGG